MKIDDTREEQLQVFLRANRSAWQFAHKACDDYLLARLAIQHWLTSGFEMSAQAVEKLLKSYLLFKDQTLRGSWKELKRRLENRPGYLGRPYARAHNVETALSLAADIGMPCSEDLRKRISRINSYYLRRYPDDGGPTTLSGQEIDDIDEAIFELWDSFSEINADYQCLCGISRPLHGSILSANNPFSRTELWVLSNGNHALARRKSAIEARIRAIKEHDEAMIQALGL